MNFLIAKNIRIISYKIGRRGNEMKPTYWKLFALLLAICMLVSCTPQVPEPPADDTQPPIEEPAQTLEFSLTKDFVIVRPDTKQEQEVEALQLLGRGLQSASGIRFSKGTDYDENECEILIGNTSREASQTASEGLSYMDWTYEVVSDKKIVVCGGSPEATLTAARAFLREIFGYEENAETQEVEAAGSTATLTVGTKVVYRHEYDVTSFRLGAHEISEYTLVSFDKKSKANDQIVDHFRRLTGKEIPVVSADEYSGGPAIFLGMAGVDGQHLDYPDFAYSRYYVVASGDNIIIDFRDPKVSTEAATRFVKTCTLKEPTKEITVTISEEPIITGIYISEGTNHLELHSVTTIEIAPGVVYEEHLYYDENDLPVRAYIITIKKGCATVETSMPGDEAKVGTVSNMKEQVVAAAANGKNVVAGINADFFDMGGSNIMEGLCIKDGAVLHGSCDRPWFGITKDGTPVVGANDHDYKKYEGQLATAVGGSNIVLKDGYASHISVGTEWGDTRHPRSAVGYKSDGSIVLMMVDGRQPEVSNGASLADVAYIMASLGCTNALNLDGGGSSTFILKDEKGNYNVENSPSDGGMRKVADGLMVVLP
jgi:exopolysaccharide biosynthesis protein